MLVLLRRLGPFLCSSNRNVGCLDGFGLLGPHRNQRGVRSELVLRNCAENVNARCMIRAGEKSDLITALPTFKHRFVQSTDMSRQSADSSGLQSLTQNLSTACTTLPRDKAHSILKMILMNIRFVEERGFKLTKQSGSYRMNVNNSEFHVIGFMLLWLSQASQADHP